MKILRKGFLAFLMDQIFWLLCRTVPEIKTPKEKKSNKTKASANCLNYLKKTSAHIYISI